MWGGWGELGKEKMKRWDWEGEQTIKDSISKNRLRVAEGRGDGRGWWDMDIGEGMCYDECCEMCKPDNSQTSSPGDKNTLYVYLNK